MPTFPGDPTLLGWTTTGLYLLAGVLALRCAYRAGQSARAAREVRADRTFWSAAAALCLLLGLNKQLDLQTRLTYVARAIAEDQGWYADRRPLQALFVIIFALGAAGALLALAIRTRPAWRANRLALLALSMLVLFIVIRVADIERVDEAIGFTFSADPIRWILEVGGLCLLSLSAWVHGSGRRPASC